MNRERVRERDVERAVHGALGGAGDVEPSVSTLVGDHEHAEPAGVDERGLAEVHDDRGGLGDRAQGILDSRCGDEVDLALDHEDGDGRLVRPGDAEAWGTC